jgi:hypothetical protein
MSTAEEFEPLFSYGTLQDEAVQIATFGRKLLGVPDTLPGFRQTRLRIQDPAVVAASGEEYYRNVQFTGLDADCIEGVVFSVTRKELEQADQYELDAHYKRIRVKLKSGTQAWVYVGIAPAES